MSALLSIVANPQVLPPDELDIFHLDGKMRQIAHAHRNNMAALSYYGWRLRYQIADDWAKLGFQSEDGYRESLGICRSTYFKHVGIGAALCTLKLADLEAIPLANRELLIQVDPNLRDQYDWVSEAKRLTSEEFALKITQRNRDRGIATEPTGRISLKVPVTAKVFIEETLESYRVQNELPTIAEALEFMVADMHDRKDNAATALTAAKNVRMAMWRLSKYPKEAWAQGWLRAAHNTLLRIARMEGVVDEKNAKAVYPPFNRQDGEDFAKWEADLLKLSGRQAGEEAEGDDAVEDAGGDVRTMPSADAADRGFSDLPGGGR